MSTDPSYTVFIRLPFSRDDFIDPPSVEWDASKDKALWKILAKNPKTSDIDWNELATKFEVTLPFLLQQAAWLYERQLHQVRDHMRKINTTTSAPSPIPGSTSETPSGLGGESMKRTGSGGGRVASALSTRRDSPIPRLESATPNTGRGAPPMSRTSSANNTNAHSHGSRLATQVSPRPANAHLRQLSTGKPPSTISPHRSPQPDALSSPAASESSASESSESPVQSRFIRRPSKFQARKLGQSEDADDDEEEPAFLPFTDAGHHDPSATLRGDPRGMTTRRTTHKGKGDVSQTSDSSASSTAPIGRRVDVGGKRPGPLSPRRTAELSKEGRESEGSPSMGSSFDDLLDGMLLLPSKRCITGRYTSSVTQSALEEAVLSNMQRGGMASRMTNFTHSVRSKYF
ncbi:hypothetical protein B0O99DRAFT_194913 [Bisporella sp. PMI_857]|nr:hypothetical protein B0O99DRAFT_194913 [Bisporella sp. PMI_857]